MLCTHTKLFLPYISLYLHNFILYIYYKLVQDGILCVKKICIVGRHLKVQNKGKKFKEANIDPSLYNTIKF